MFRGRSPPAISGTLGCIQATFPRPPGPHPRTVFIEQKPKLNPARERRNRNLGVQHTGHGKRKSGRRAVGRRVWRRPVARHRGAPRREPARRASERCSIFSEAPWAQLIQTDNATFPLTRVHPGPVFLQPSPPCLCFFPLPACRFLVVHPPSPASPCGRSLGTGVRGCTGCAAFRQAPHPCNCQRHDDRAGHHRACIRRVRQRESPSPVPLSVL